VQSLRWSRMARDAMLGLSKTCRKLRLSFFDYLGDRLQLNGVNRASHRSRFL
jgi:hypothetical protein